MNFQDRLDRAIERGHRAADARLRVESEKTLSEEEYRRLHSRCRLELSEHVENCIRMTADRFPGFQYHSIVGEEGWGARITRDDLQIRPGERGSSVFSRMELTISPYRSAHILELVGKATVRNKELYHRTNFQRLSDVDLDSFREVIDLWVLEFAERFAAQ
jgi:hypothetical protein